MTFPFNPAEITERCDICTGNAKDKIEQAKTDGVTNASLNICSYHEEMYNRNRDEFHRELERAAFHTRRSFVFNI